jgi:PTH2 family peptidyl-tRNA hydrolase
MDHAPNWANGREADRKQGLVAEKPKDTGEECKLVLVVRTDLGMTKGTSILSLVAEILSSCAASLLTSTPRQNRCAMLPRHPRLLQGPVARQARLSRTKHPLPLGAPWPG